MQLKYVLTTLALSPLTALAAERIYPQKRQNNGGGGDPLTSLCLDPSIIQPASAKTGQEDVTAGQVESATSTNNFINECTKFPDVAITNGEQIFEGSCLPIPVGRIMAKDKMPAQFILNPKNNDVVPEGTDITFQIKTKNMDTGHFTNAQLTYYSAPTQLNAQGILIAHSHVTVSPIDSLTDTEPKDIQTFSFFKGLNDPADGNGVLSATAVGGLKAGFYRVCSLGSNANHMAIVPPVAQRASENDCIRFTVSAAGGNGGAANNGTAAGGNGGNGGAAAGGAAAGGAANGGAAAGGAANGGAAAGGAANGGAANGGAANGGAAAGGAANGGAAAGGAKNGGAKNGGGRGAGRGQGRGGRNGQKRSNLPSENGRRSFSPSSRSRIARTN